MGKKDIKIYTDGACSGNQFKDNMGGWAFLVISDPPLVKSGAEKNTTNNKMELLACIQALDNVIDKKLCNENVQLYSDSQYVVNGMNKWRKNWVKKCWKNSEGQDVKNKDLWQQLIELNEKCPTQFKHVDGHSGDVYNEKVNEIAVYQTKKKI